MPQTTENPALCAAWQSSAEASRAAGLEWRRKVARLALLDQELAASKSGGLGAIAGMTECVVTSGKALLELLVLQAQMQQLHRQLNSQNGTYCSKDALAYLEELCSPSLEYQARAFIANCARRIDVCLEWLHDCLNDGDLEAARTFGQHARRMILALREIQENWPWSDAEITEQSWRQYQQGTLMDYEAFKHELLKAAE